MSKVTKNSLKARLIRFNDKKVNHLPILSGPPETVSLHSGLVSLSNGKSVGKHSTKNYEELIVFLEGRGQVQITGQKPFEINSGVAVYIPSETEHNVVNTGNSPLRYIYIVALTKS